MKGMNVGAPWQPGSGPCAAARTPASSASRSSSICSSKGAERRFQPDSGHASGSHGPCLVEVLGRSAQEGCHGVSLCRLAAGTCLPKFGRGEILNLERLGIAQSVMPELSPAAVYRVGETVVKGEADIALHQIPELMAVPKHRPPLGIQ